MNLTPEVIRVLLNIEEFSSESDSTSSSSSDTDESSTSSEEEDEILVKRRKLVPERRSTGASLFTFHDKDFWLNYRLTKSTVNIILATLHAKMKSNVKPVGRKTVDPEKSLLMTLWYLGNSETFKDISSRFLVTKSTAHKTVNYVVKFLVEIAEEYINWPNSAECEIIATDFQEKGFHGVMGAIDGSFIKISKPKVDAEAYVGTNKFHSIKLQGVCDCKGRFIDVFCGEVGSMHNSEVLLHSPLYEKKIAEENHQYFLLGDNSYPSLPWLVPPFQDNDTLTEEQKIFNTTHSSARSIIEHTFGLLKGRFMRLRGFTNINLKFVAESVIAACVLHNLCTQQNEDNFDMYVEEFVKSDTFEDSDLSADRRYVLYKEMFQLY